MSSQQQQQQQQQQVSRHYDSLAVNTLSRRKRRALPTYALREFNNNVKRAMIESVASMRNVHGRRILDICCGRGGDVVKYDSLQPSYVLFVDVSESSIIEAKRRYDMARDDGKINYVASFRVVDCFSPALTDTVLVDEEPFDVVTCFFALHYAFASRERVTQLFSTIKRHLTPGGYFMATFPSYTALRLCATSSGPRAPVVIDTNHPCYEWASFSRPHCRVEIRQKITNESSVQFGQEYFFTLDSAVAGCAEYLVPPQLLDFYTQTFSLRPVVKAGFIAYALSMGIDVSTITRSGLRYTADLYDCLIAVHTGATQHDEQVVMPDAHTNYRGMLQEWCQARGYSLPVFTDEPVDDYRQWRSTVVVISPTGWQVKCRSSSHVTKKRAHHDAARIALAKVTDEDDTGADFVSSSSGRHNSVKCDDVTDTPSSAHAVETSGVVKEVAEEETALLAESMPYDNHVHSPHEASLVVHIDADHISFISTDSTRLYPSVYFIYYCAFGSDLGFLRDDNNHQAFPNMEIRRASQPLKNLADSMILCAASSLSNTLATNTRQLVVSRDASVFHAQLLVPNVVCTATREDTWREIDALFAPPKQHPTHHEDERK